MRRIWLVPILVVAFALGGYVVTRAVSNEGRATLDCAGDFVEGGQLTCTISNLEVATTTTVASSTTRAATTTTTVRLPTTLASTTTTPPADAAFFENFESGAQSLDRFRWQIFHGGAGGFITHHEWNGDHSMACEAPPTIRLVHAQVNGPNRGEMAFWCAPNGAGSGHMMTTFHTSGYGQVDFSPNQRFDSPSRICWDQNMTFEGRRWTQVIVVAESVFQANGQRLNYVSPVLEGGVGENGVRTANGVTLLTLHEGQAKLYTNHDQYSENFADFGFTTQDKARRFRNCMVDLENGNIRIEMERERSTVAWTLAGSLPNGSTRVIFQDDDYDDDKDTRVKPSDAYTWHWDNILID